MINPACMTRQVHELGALSTGVVGHITSLNPIRPQNAPDPWETRALHLLEKGTDEVSAIEKTDGIEYYRLIRPLITEHGCLKCHQEQGYMEGDIRGGISVSGPLNPIQSNIRDDEGYWQQVEHYVQERSEATFSHGLCPECIKELFPELKKKKP